MFGLASEASAAFNLWTYTFTINKTPIMVAKKFKGGEKNPTSSEASWHAHILSISQLW